jgi:hypothetical protein
MSRVNNVNNMNNMNSMHRNEREEGLIGHSHGAAIGYLIR